jgi:hypothetical protein
MLDSRGRKLGLTAVVLCLTLCAAIAHAGSDKPTMSASGQVFYATSKSGLAQSNDTGIMMNYGLHVFAGTIRISRFIWKVPNQTLHTP